MARAAAAQDLASLAAACAGCTECRLSGHRRQVVFGEGAQDAEVMFVGEAPGRTEDETGRPFVGRAGQLLTRIIENAMGVPRSATYIANINKCRPPGNRDPQPDEVGECIPLLRRQIELIRPKVLVALGKVAANNLVAQPEAVLDGLGGPPPYAMRHLRRATSLEYAGIPVVATWHPAYLLRNASAKSETWADIKRVNRLLGRPEVPPPWTGSGT